MASRKSGNPAKRAAVDRARAEARKALADEGSSTTLKLTGVYGETSINVPDFLDWDSDAYGLLRAGDFGGWAESILSPEDLDKWHEVRPNNRHAGQLIADWEDSTGEDLGESEAS